MDQLNLCDDVLKVIGEYASIKIETKKYKSKKNNNKMKINKIKYKCYVCGALNNKNQYWFNQYRCKNINKCIEKCGYYFWSIKYHELKRSIKYINMYGYNYNNILKYNAVVDDLHRKFCDDNTMFYDSNVINKHVLNFDNTDGFRETKYCAGLNPGCAVLVCRYFGGIFRDQRFTFQ